MTLGETFQSESSAAELGIRVCRVPNSWREVPASTVQPTTTKSNLSFFLQRLFRISCKRYDKIVSGLTHRYGGRGTTGKFGHIGYIDHNMRVGTLPREFGL
jgi:hypothetical protein